MVSRADTTLDLRVLESILLLDVLALLLIASLPSCDGAEEDILCDRRGICLRAYGFALLGAEFGPLLAFGDARVYHGFDRRLFDAAGRLDLLAVFAERVGYDGFAAVFVFGYGLLGELERVFVVVFGPVGVPRWRVSAVCMLESGESRLTLLLETCWR